MPSRDQMWGPMSLEEYAEKLGEDLSRRPMPLTGLEDLPDMGALRTARKGDSISSILGSSDPAAIGAFMDVNGMKDSRLRVGESYLIPRRADLADQSMAGRGQAALNADNARAVERARRTILPGDAVTARPRASSFDPQKGILATRSAVTDPKKQSKSRDGWEKGSKVASIAGHVVNSYDLQNHILDLMFKGKDIAKTVGPRMLGPVLTLAEHTAAGIGEAVNGAPKDDVAAGVVGKLGVIGLGVAGGTAIGGPIGGIIGGTAAGLGLNGVSNEELGRKVKAQMEELGRNPYGYGAF